MSTNEALKCAECGFLLGLGTPGALKYCVRCGKDVLTEAKEGKPIDALGLLVVLGLGLGAAALVTAILKSLSD